MDVIADRQPRMAWGLQHVRSGVIPACTIVGTEKEAKALLLGFHKHLPHKGKYVAVPILLTVEKG